MAKSFGITFAVDAKLNPTVASVFSTVEQKVRASTSQIQQLNAKAKVLATAEAAKQRVAETQKLFAASGGRDPMLREALNAELAAFNKAAAAAKKYGVEIRDIAQAHAQTDRALAQTRNRLDALQKAENYKAKRQEAAASLKAAVVPALAIAKPINDAIKFETAMASAAKTIDGMRDESGKLTAQYYEMEAAIMQMGQILPLTHDELAKLFAAGGQQGLTAVNDLREFTTLAAQMAVAFDMSQEDAASSIGGFRSALNMTMPQARELLGLLLRQYFRCQLKKYCGRRATHWLAWFCGRHCRQVHDGYRRDTGLHASYAGSGSNRNQESHIGNDFRNCRHKRSKSRILFIGHRHHQTCQRAYYG